MGSMSSMRHKARSAAIGLVGRIPPVRRLRKQRDELHAQLMAREAELRERDERDVAAAQRAAADADVAAAAAEEAARSPYNLYPPGHFYSPVPDIDDTLRRGDALFARDRDVLGIDLGIDDQWALMDELASRLAQWPYADPAAAEGGPAGLRYQPDNGYFGWTDSQLWFALLGQRRPARVIEVGCGWSTALMLDACDRFRLDARITAIEPYPDRLKSVMRPGDERRLRLLERPAQQVAPEELADLGDGDVLFIDSTHVSKIGSDVNHLMFEVLPRLRPGVLVHIHDIAYPFEYPAEWIAEGRAWNEAYLLHAFLLENPRWRVLLWPSLLWIRDPRRMGEALATGSIPDGGSLWLEVR